MYNLAEVLRIVAILTSPYIPSTSPKIYTPAGPHCSEQFLLADTAWGGLPDGTKVQKGEPLYPRIEITESGETVIAATKKTAPAAKQAVKAEVKAEAKTESKTAATEEITIE